MVSSPILIFQHIQEEIDFLYKRAEEEYNKRDENKKASLMMSAEKHDAQAKTYEIVAGRLSGLLTILRDS